ncbi:MAG: hypothetical protein JXR03_15590 [Cyclobacteriaceae bacterium]
MESQIKELIAKYWEGETTLEEEREVKQYFKTNPQLTPSGDYFSKVRKLSSEHSKGRFSHPGKKKLMVRWSAAAAILIGVSTAIFVLQDTQRTQNYLVEDPKEAYEITRNALLMVSSGLNNGTAYSANELKKINEAEEIIMN